VKVIHSDRNLGFAGGNNLGIQVALGKYLFFINNDTVFRDKRLEVRGEIDSLIQRLESSEEIGMVCPKIRFTWDHHPIQFAGYTPLSRITVRNQAIGCGEADYGQYDTAHPTPYAHGAAMMVKREAIEKAGMMPECYFLYYEELDWSLMIRRAGYTIWYEPACTIYHKESQATGQDSPLRTYYLTRNRLLFVRRNSPDITSRFLSYLYLICIVAVKDSIKYLIHLRPDLAKAVVKGIYHFINHSAS
jgi:GT2 family glycosyltransferase